MPLWAEWTGHAHVTLVALIAQGSVGSGEGSPCKGKGVKEAKREKKENTDHKTKNMYSLWVCAYMH